VASLLKEKDEMSLHNFLKINLKLCLLENEMLTFLFTKLQRHGPLYCREFLPSSVFTLIIIELIFKS
jgi:hypothetical protein